jgi:hypothetical protein
MSRFPAPTRILLIASILSLPLAAQTAPAPNIDRRAALVEVTPSESIQRSPAATDLVNRLIKKHVLLLQHPALITQVLQNSDVKRAQWTSDKNVNAVDKLVSAIRVRVIPDSNIIELMVDPAAAGEEASMLAEAIVNQHLENQKQIGQNAQLERSVVLNNLKQRYQFRKDELSRDLREKAVQLSVDGMGMPGRLSAKEVELEQLIKLKFEVQRKRSEAKTPEEQKMVDSQYKEVEERVDAAKADLGALTNAVNQYLTLKDDEKAIRETLGKINAELEQISQQANNMSGMEVRWLCHPSK